MKGLKTFHIGLDDTDSKDGMCTTYIGIVIIDKLKEIGIRLLDYPRLIRLNPNWKLKTRGNCAIAFSVEAELQQIHLIKKIVLETIERLAEMHHKTTNPGVAFMSGIKIPDKLKEFSKKVIQDIVTIDEAEKVANNIGAEIFKFKIGRGIIGALAAIGEQLENDKTFELVAYRIPENWGSKRKIDKNSVKKMDKLTFPDTFDNIDPSSDEIRIAPHTPCPILYGIRSEKPEVAIRAHRLIKSLEKIERWIIYKTNQGTDEHIIKDKIKNVIPNLSYEIGGEVCENPRIIKGGHVIFKMKDKSGLINCAAYEPTRKFREIVTKLVEGDKIRVFGGVKKKPDLPLTLNLEKMEVLELSLLLKKKNPQCPICNKKTKSAGHKKGFICKKCRVKLPEETAIFEKVKRNLSTQIYEVPPRARRHLAKPILRF